jgi:hypothetical protein
MSNVNNVLVFNISQIYVHLINIILVMSMCMSIPTLIYLGNMRLFVDVSTPAGWPE